MHVLLFACMHSWSLLVDATQCYRLCSLLLLCNAPAACCCPCEGLCCAACIHCCWVAAAAVILYGCCFPDDSACCNGGYHFHLVLVLNTLTAALLELLVACHRCSKLKFDGTAAAGASAAMVSAIVQYISCMWVPNNMQVIKPMILLTAYPARFR